MPVITKFIRVLIAVALTIAGAAVLTVLTSEIFVIWYMNDNNVVARIDLSEDYGFGMLGFLISVVTIVLAVPVCGFAA